jgi:glycosyltransferase involved in cell wall biosynthesis
MSERPIRVVQVNRNDTVGGAARITLGLHKELGVLGVDSHLLVADSRTGTKHVHGPSNARERVWKEWAPMLDQFPLRRYKQRKPADFSPGWVGGNTLKRIRALDPDIVHLHWTTAGFLRIEDLPKIHKPLVWTFHDRWPITGGCHVTSGCEKFTERCGACPILGSKDDHDLARKIFSRKERAWRNLPIHVAAVSESTAEFSRRSQLFRHQDVTVIHNGITLERFRPRDKQLMRRELGLPQDRKLILFGAIGATSDRNKGFHLLQPALQRLAQRFPDCHAVVFGSEEPDNPPDLGMPITYLGSFEDRLSLSFIYSAADVTVVPSLEEGLASTAIESLACETPVVCFDSTGLKDVVDHQENGWRATCFDEEDLAAGIAWVLEDPERARALAAHGRAKVERCFTRRRMAEQYRALYERILGRSH